MHLNGTAPEEENDTVDSQVLDFSCREELRAASVPVVAGK